MKTSHLRLKLVELNFFASFNVDDQRKTYVSDVSKYTFKSSRLTFSIKIQKGPDLFFIRLLTTFTDTACNRAGIS